MKLDPTHMRPAAVPAWERLQASLINTTPPCTGDARYVAERTDLEPVDMADMALVCSMCPLLTLCREYRDRDRPRGGFWAGVAS